MLTRKDPAAEGKLKRMSKRGNQYGQSAKMDLRAYCYAFKVVTGLSLTMFVPLKAGTDPRNIEERPFLSLGGDMGGSMKARVGNNPNLREHLKHCVSK